MIGIIDISSGNAKSVYNAYRYLNIKAELIHNPIQLRDVKKMILPGVGNFGDYMTRLRLSGFADIITDLMKHNPIPLLGICVGAQAMLDRSEESPYVLGLSLIPGTVKSISNFGAEKIPNVGWREVTYTGDLFSRHYKCITNSFYFSHSYSMSVDENLVVAKFSKNREMQAIIQRGNIIGVQFHPEKSNTAGLKFLSDFSKWNYGTN